MTDHAQESIDSAAKYASLFNGKCEPGNAVFEAYKIAMDVRKFEIELYWKRATYFWAFIVVAFGAYGATLSARYMDPLTRSNALFAAASIGTVLSLAMYYVTLGSKFWQRNWEYQVDLLEDAAVGPLYKHVFSKAEGKRSFTSAYPYSVSNINSILAVFFFWLFLMIAFMDSGIVHAAMTVTSGGSAPDPAWPKIFVCLLSVCVIFLLRKDGRTNSAKSTAIEKLGTLESLNITHSYRNVNVTTKDQWSPPTPPQDGPEGNTPTPPA